MCSSFITKKAVVYTQDTPLAFAITMVTWVAPSTSQTWTRVKEDTQSDLSTWQGEKKIRPTLANIAFKLFTLDDYLMPLGKSF